jgi:Uma2 family endonuclease
MRRARMVANRTPPRLTVEEYLESEPRSEVKREYIDGETYAMSGGTIDQAAISLNLASLLRNHLRGSPCRVHSSDVKVRINDRAWFMYPDISVSCDEQDRGTADTVRRPSVIVEVLSPSTEAYDRGDKFARYRESETLQEYVLASSLRVAVECYRRGPNSLWTLQPFGPDVDVVLPSLDFRCPISAIYEDIAI